MRPVLLHDYKQALVYGNISLLILMVISHINRAAFFFFRLAGQSSVGLGLLIFVVCASHSDRPHSVGLFGASNRPVAPDSTQHSQQTDIHASSKIQTRNPRKRAAAVPRLRPRGLLEGQ